MSEAMENPEPLHGSDEENARLTPKRPELTDNQDAESTVLMETNSTEQCDESVISALCDVADEAIALERVINDNNTAAEEETEKTSLSASDMALKALLASESTADVLIKDEPPDKDSSDITESTVAVERPQIFLVPMSHLRVKAEVSETTTSTSEASHVIPKGFFDDLLSADSLTVSKTETEPIPDNFFDDLLVDRVKERIEENECEELEEKFSDRLKVLRELENCERTKDKKRHKKSKKKSRKRSRSRSRSLSRGRDIHSPTVKQPRTSRINEEVMVLPSTSKAVRSQEGTELADSSHIKGNCNVDASPMVPENESQEHASNTTNMELLDEIENTNIAQPHLPEIGPHLTAKQKRERIIIRAKSLASYLKNAANAEEKSSSFLYTCTMRKLPASNSYRTQNIYENRSPLHTIQNVCYKFNSHRSQFNYEEWGLASLPPLSAKLAKLVGYDAEAVCNKLKTMKIPAKLKSVKSEALDDEEDALPQSRSSLFSSVSTQTDEMVEVMPRKAKGYDIGVEAKPISFEIACQTLETESPSIRQFDNNDDLPIMTIMRELNENQLMALHDFAELIKEPATNAMDMYRLRQRMIEIYKCSQIPSALEGAVGATSDSSTSHSFNEYSTTTQNFPKQEKQDSAIRIQTVSSADGQRFSINESQMNYTGHRNRDVANNSVVIRNINDVSQTRDYYDPRNPSISQRNPYQTYDSQRSYNNRHFHPPANNANKYYGRGGLRR